MIPLLLAPLVSMLAEKGLGAVSKLIEGGADKALDVIAEKTGIDLTQTEPLTPEQEAKLREYDLQLKTLDFEREKAYLSDVNSARNMQVEALRQDDKFSKRFVYIFAAVWSLFACAYIGAITFYPIPEPNVRFADTILGFLLGTVVATILNFFFGSSMGSKQKSETLARSVQ
jgi:hypothetical protein